MARTVRDTKLDTPEARLRLKVGQRYFRTLGDGAALCYRKTTDKYGTWSVRIRREDGTYTLRALGMADGQEDPDGNRVLDFFQANDRAREEVRRFHAPAPRAVATVRKAAEKYLEWYREQRKAYAETKASIDAHIIPELGDVPISELTKVQIEDWLLALARKPRRKRVGIGKKRKPEEKAETEDARRARRATANRVFTMLRAILNFAFQQNMVDDDKEWRKVKPFPNVDTPVIRYLTPTDATRLVNASPIPFRHLVAAALHTGARYSELARMLVADFNAHHGSVHIQPGKSGKARNVPLSVEGQEFFAARVAGKAGNALIFARSDGSAWGKSYQIRPLAEACATAKVAPAISFHVLRHTYGSALAKAGVPLLTISKLLGHADMRITSRHYAHIADRELQTAVDKLPTLNMKKDTKVRAIR